MEFYLSTSESPYRIKDVEHIQTPRLLVFQDRLLKNIKTMRRLLSQANPNLTLANLCPHVKTHKSAWVTQELLNAGISFFKTTLNELALVLNAGAKNVFIAYPLLDLDAENVEKAMREFSDTQFYVQVSHPAHVDILKRVSKHDSPTWHYFIDVNVGMNRTGLAPDSALELYKYLAADPRFEFAGLHGYEGHIHQVSAEERETQAWASMDRLYGLCKTFENAGIRVPKTVVGGTPSFLFDAAYFAKKPLDTELYVSPGTWIYFDSISNELMPNTFDMAAVILAQVIDVPTTDTATLNIGHKRWAVDQGAIDTFSVLDLEALRWNEEHTVVQVPENENLSIGDYVLFAPRHVCSTVNLWEYFGIIDASGNLVSSHSSVDARNR